MTLTTRRRLFYVFIGVFLLAGTLAILYAQGWRLDTGTLRIKKVGAVYVRSFPKSADIFLNDKKIEKGSGLFESGTLVNGLFPKTYLLNLTKEGYKDWRKTIAIVPAAVVEVKYAVLVPIIESNVSSGTAKYFWIVNHELLFQNEAGELIWREKTLVGDKLIGWTEDFKKLLAFDSRRNLYAWNDLEDGSHRDLRLSGTVMLDPDNSSKLILVTSSSLSVLDLQTNSVTNIYRANGKIVQGLAMSGNKITWTTWNSKENYSTFMTYDTFSGEQKEYNEKIPGRTVSSAWTKNRLGILENNGGFYIWNNDSQSLSKIASDVKSFSISDDGMTIATLENSSLEIFSLSDNHYSRFNLRDKERIRSIEWYHDNNHIFIEYPDKVAFLDVNDTALENITTIAETTESRYDAGPNKFYFLKDGSVEKLDFPN